LLCTNIVVVQGTTLALRLAGEGNKTVAASLAGVVLLGAASAGNAGTIHAANSNTSAYFEPEIKVADNLMLPNDDGCFVFERWQSLSQR
jgi:hypothetical protein